jgi:hypothetical protein
MEFLDLVCKRENVNAIQVFVAAFDYREIRIPSEQMLVLIMCCCKPINERQLQLVFLPELVEDFCLDILAKRVEMPKRECTMYMFFL